MGALPAECRGGKAWLGPGLRFQRVHRKGGLIIVTGEATSTMKDVGGKGGGARA